MWLRIARFSNFGPLTPLVAACWCYQHQRAFVYLRENLTKAGWTSAVQVKEKRHQILTQIAEGVLGGCCAISSNELELQKGNSKGCQGNRIQPIIFSCLA